jgi:multidrug efflux pump subunit AcrB
MVPLSALVKVQEIEAPLVVDRYNGRLMVRVTANLASGLSPPQARALCEKLAAEVRQELRLPADYRLSWLEEIPIGK